MITSACILSYPVAVPQPLSVHPRHGRGYPVQHVQESGVAPGCEFIAVALKVLEAPVVAGAVISPLEQHPKRLDAIGMRHPSVVVVSAMVEDLVPAQSLVACVCSLRARRCSRPRSGERAPR